MTRPADAPALRTEEELLAAVRADEPGAAQEFRHRHGAVAVAVARMHGADDATARQLADAALDRVLTGLGEHGRPRRFVRARLVAAVAELAAERGEPRRPRPSDAVVGVFLRLPEDHQAVLWHTDVESLRYGRAAGALTGLRASAAASLHLEAQAELRAAWEQEKLAHPVTPSCAATAADLGELLDGTLPAERAHAVREHLDDCPRCTADRLHLLDTDEGLRGWVLPVLAGLPLWGVAAERAADAVAVAAAAHAPAPRRPADPPYRSSRADPAAAAAAAVPAVSAATGTVEDRSAATPVVGIAEDRSAAAPVAGTADDRPAPAAPAESMFAQNRLLRPGAEVLGGVAVPGAADRDGAGRALPAVGGSRRGRAVLLGAGVLAAAVVVAGVAVSAPGGLGAGSTQATDRAAGSTGDPAASATTSSDPSSAASTAPGEGRAPEDTTPAEASAAPAPPAADPAEPNLPPAQSGSGASDGWPERTGDVLELEPIPVPVEPADPGGRAAAPSSAAGNTQGGDAGAGNTPGGSTGVGNTQGGSAGVDDARITGAGAAAPGRDPAPTASAGAGAAQAGATAEPDDVAAAGGAPAGNGGGASPDPSGTGTSTPEQGGAPAPGAIPDRPRAGAAGEAPGSGAGAAEPGGGTAGNQDGNGDGRSDWNRDRSAWSDGRGDGRRDEVRYDGRRGNADERGSRGDG